MFEYGNEGTEPTSIIFYCGVVVLALIRVLYPVPLLGFLLEAYILTCLTFVTLPFQFQKPDTKKLWFWKTMLTAGVLIHVPLLVGLWFVDFAYPILLSGILPMFVITVVILVPEVTLFDRIIKRYRPERTEEGALTS